uniref:Uncharacterized protein n=1 Tax=Tenebrio molitor TaxID=7067 RepID=A0A8J6H3F5_TENMO|nr:hypothetical protein GEV33_015373 [Tenebrio molitor]
MSIVSLQVRRSLKIRGRRKEKEKLPSGITADYTADFLASLERVESPASTIPGSPSNINHLQEGYTQSDSSETSLNSLNNPQNNKILPPLPPKPPKRGILKTPRVSVTQDNGHDTLVRNTMQNELCWSSRRRRPARTASPTRRTPRSRRRRSR